MIKKLYQRMSAATGFLTAIPVSGHDAKALSRSIVFFPFVGLGLGCLQWLQYVLLAGRVHPSLNALGLVLAGALWTRGLHLDGLADSTDALLSHRDTRQMLAIMRDSRIGTMGMLALFFDLVIRWQVLAHVSWGSMPAALIVPPVLGRMAMGVGLTAFPYARQMGLVTPFLQGRRTWDLAIVLLLGAALAVLMTGIQGPFFWSAALLIALGIFSWCKKNLGGFTGDILGAVNETVELACLGIIAAGAR